MTDPNGEAKRDLFTALLLETAQCVRFYSRLPVPALPFETDPHGMPDFTRIVRMLPLAALFIALPGAVAMILAGAFWSPWIAALLAVMVQVWATGAFHEDGLADTADGFGGGATPERRLAIMTDSRVGTFGAAALVFSILLRAAALTEIVDAFGPGAGALALLAVAPLSRTLGLVPLWYLENAKPDGRSAAVGRPGGRLLTVTLSISLVIAVLILQGADVSPGQGLSALLAAAIVVLPLIRMSRRLIGGQTGDVAGAAQQLSETAFLLVLAAVPQPL
jgi:adenosylcobinamide-GDP ribazoletransferase